MIGEAAAKRTNLARVKKKILARITYNSQQLPTDNICNPLCCHVMTMGYILLTFEQKVVFVVLAGHGGPLCRRKISGDRPHTVTLLNARKSFQVFFLPPPDSIISHDSPGSSVRPLSTVYLPLKRLKTLPLPTGYHTSRWRL